MIISAVIKKRKIVGFEIEFHQVCSKPNSYNQKTYPQFKVAQPIYYAKCLSSSTTRVNTTSVELHKEALSYRAKPMIYKRKMSIHT